MKGEKMFTRVRAVHIAVKNVEEAASEYSENLGLEVSRSGVMADMGIKNAILPVGESVLELIEPLDPQQGVLARFLQNRGEGVYMIALEVDDLESAIKSFQSKGVRLIDAEPESRARGGPVFIHPKSSHGVLIELIEKAP
jgi:methylmalonyl-CoA/ethylmalonyl-CoA epimerase